MKFKHLTLSTAFVLAAAAVSMAQQSGVVEANHDKAATESATSQNGDSGHLVTVNVKNGEPIKGKFIGADADSLQVDMGSARATIKLDDVVSIIFSTDSAKGDQPSTPSGAQQSVSDAIRTLRKLDGATQVGVTFLQYGSLLIEAKGPVDDALSVLPTGELKQEIQSAMADYVIAGQAWNESLKSPGATGVPTGSTLASVINERYSLGLTLKRGKYLDRRQIIETIWGSAREHLNRAAALVRQNQ